jgi:hypothetical protein
MKSAKLLLQIFIGLMVATTIVFPAGFATGFYGYMWITGDRGSHFAVHPHIRYGMITGSVSVCIAMVVSIVVWRCFRRTAHHHEKISF